MKKKLILPIVLGVVTVVLAVVSFLLLPETVVTQLSLGASGVTTMPKLVAVLLPTAMGAGGAAIAAFSDGEKSGRNKWLIVSAVGIAVFAVMLAVNL